MFLPQKAEKDCYDKNGRQYDDINTVVEYVRYALGYDKTSDDEDDDAGNNFIPARGFNILISLEEIQPILQDLPAHTQKLTFPVIQDRCNVNVFIEIASPPPDLAV